MPNFYKTVSYLGHKLYEINSHSLHSPSLYKLYEDCFKAAKKIPADPDIENLRKQFKKDESMVDIVDFGSGSQYDNNLKRSIRSIARRGISRLKYSKLFVQLTRHYGFKNILELGTSLGINTLYLARSNDEVQVSTFEGNMYLADIAERAFNDLRCNNIHLIRGNIDDTLPNHLRNTTDIDLIFMDANHTYEATFSYFDQVISRLSFQSLLIIDDIYRDRTMTKAWKDIKKRFPKATYIDIYQCGIIIFDKNSPAMDIRLAF